MMKRSEGWIWFSEPELTLLARGVRSLLTEGTPEETGTGLTRALPTESTNRLQAVLEKLERPIGNVGKGGDR